MNRRRIRIALLALLVAGMAGGVWLSREPRRSPPARGRPAHGVALERALQAIASGDSAMPRDRWDPAYVSARLGSDPMVHLRWVRERSLWIPYHGVLRGPTGVLMDGQGNSLDRALLLASLLTNAGHQVRLAHGEMSEEMAAELLPRLVAMRREAVGDTSTRRETAWRGEIQQLAGAHGFNAADLLRTIDARLDEVTRMFRELDVRTDDQAQRLARALPAGRVSRGGPDRFRRAAQALRDHWWVQMQEQGRWIDLDVLGDARGAARAQAAETVSPEMLDSTLYHRVAIRLVTERASRGTLTETVALDQTVRTADVAAGPITLQLMPESWRPGFVGAGGEQEAAFRTQMLQEQKWRAALTIGKTVVAQAVIARSGVARAPSGEGFGGLGGAIAGALGPADRSTGELSAAWLEYAILTPGQPASVIRRQLFDLVGPAARSSRRSVTLELDDARRLERSLALFHSIDILPLGSAVAPIYLLHLAAQSAVANGTLLRMPELPAGSTATTVLDRLNQLGAPLPSVLYSLAIARMPAALERDVFLDRPNVLTRHDFLASRGSRVERLTATDIVANDVGVTLDAPNPPEARRRQGVRDTNAEALVHGGSGPLASVADMYAAGGKWATISSADDRLVATLPPGLRARIVDDLRSGHVVVVPITSATAADATSTGWWRIDSLTGETLGVSGIGWGQSAVEKAAIIMGAVAVAWTWEYLICSGSLYVPGSSQTVSRAGSPIDWFAPPLYALATSNDDCIFDAWVAGITSGVLQSMTVVWPFLISKIPALKFFERPAFATGDVGPGDAPPIFGGGSGKGPASAPPEPCPPGAGGMPAGGHPDEGPIDPLGKTQPGGPPAPPAEESGAPVAEGEPAPKPAEDGPAPKPPQEEAAPQPSGSGAPHLDESAGDMPPFEQAQVDENVRYWTQQAEAAKPQLDASRARAQETYEAAQAAEQEYQAAETAFNANKEDMQLFRKKLEADVNRKETQKVYEAAYAAYAKRVHAIRMAEYWSRIQPLNEALIQARGQMRDVSQSFGRAVQEGAADFEGPQYREWKAAWDRYQQSLREFVAAVQGRAPGASGVAAPAPSPNSSGQDPAQPAAPQAGPGQTQPLAQSPTIADPNAGAVPGPVAAAGPGGTMPLPGSPSPSGPKPGSPGGTMPLPAPPGNPACPGAAAGGSSPGGAGQGGVPAGKGPFQGDPETRDWLREQWHPDPAQAHPAAGALGDPAIYDAADQAALARYNAARAQGMDDQAARRASFEEWNASVQSQRRARGIEKQGRIGEYVKNPPAPESQVLVGAGVMAGGEP